MSSDTPLSNCTLETCPIHDAYVNYDPSLVANALYTGIFGTLLLIQIFQGYHFKTWAYSTAMCVGLIGETLGYIARVQMHFNPFLPNPFLMYLSCLTISPVFFAAAVYLCLSQIVVIYGSEYSRFRPRTYTILFITCDFISLILQAVGGVIADTNLTDLPMQLTGVHVMVGGLAFQVSSLLLFALLSAEYAWRVKRQKKARMTEYIHISNRKCFHCFLYSLTFATLCIITRSCFRLAELEGGFSSALANNQVMLMIFDGAMMVLACLALTVFHAGLAFEGNW